MEINNFLERLLAASPDTITLLVLVGCLLLLVFSFWSRRLRDIAPALMVSAGIIGTFWGTFIALGDFQTGAESGGGLDHQAMVESIPKVLSGMKSAFVTSLIGLFFGFFSKFGFRIFFKETLDALPHEKNILNLLRDIKNGISGEGDKSLSSQIERLQAENSDGFKNLDARLAGLANAKQTKAMMDELRDDILRPLTEATRSLEGIKEGIAGDSDSSVVSRLAQLRGDNNLGFKQLDSRVKDTAIDTLNALNQIREGIVGDGDFSVVSRLAQLKEENSRGFAQLNKQLDGLSKAIIDAVLKGLVKQMEETDKFLRKQLGDMITRIEVALIDQFGKTFKEFNEATQAIKKWQEEHRAHVVQLTDAFQTAATEITRIRAECEHIPATMNSWKELMGELNENLRSFAHIKKEAEQFLPAIKGHLDSVANDLRESAGNFKKLERDIQTIRQEIEKSQKTLTAMANDHATKLDSTVANIVREWGEQMVGIAEQLSREIKNLR